MSFHVLLFVRPTVPSAVTRSQKMSVVQEFFHSRNFNTTICPPVEKESKLCKSKHVMFQKVHDAILDLICKQIETAEAIRKTKFDYAGHIRLKSELGKWLEAGMEDEKWQIKMTPAGHLAGRDLMHKVKAAHMTWFAEKWLGWPRNSLSPSPSSSEILCFMAHLYFVITWGTMPWATYFEHGDWPPQHLMPVRGGDPSTRYLVTGTMADWFGKMVRSNQSRGTAATVNNFVLNSITNNTVTNNLPTSQRIQMQMPASQLASYLQRSRISCHFPEETPIICTLPHDHIAHRSSSYKFDGHSWVPSEDVPVLECATLEEVDRFYGFEKQRHCTEFHQHYLHAHLQHIRRSLTADLDVFEQRSLLSVLD